MPRDYLKQELLDRIDFTKEFDRLLGPGKGNTRRCWNKVGHSHDDKSPSLSFNKEHGGWKCHSCNETGDIFTIFMKVHGKSFPQVYRMLLEEYGLWSEIEDFEKNKRKQTANKSTEAITDPAVKTHIIESLAVWSASKASTGKDLLAFMWTRYGLTYETLMRWRIGYHARTKRVWIPIWAMRSSNESNNKWQVHSIVNVRKHDCFRTLCSWYNTETKETVTAQPESVTLESIALQETHPWEPVWGASSGKVISVKGHGAPYLYPFEVLLDNTFVYLVGGELKALLLNQLGIPAVTFTVGEGSINEIFLPYFIGKSVRVLFDADPAAKRDENGMCAADRQAITVARYLANVGAYVEYGAWPEEVRKLLPPKGDVTDFLRMADWNTAALDLLPWTKVERQQEDELEEDVRTIEGGEEIPTLNEMIPIPFSRLVDPSLLGKYVKFRGLIAGRGDTPYVIPTEAYCYCRAGEASHRPKCNSCSLPHTNYRKRIRYSVTAQVSLVGTPPDMVDAMLRKELQITRGCEAAEIEYKSASVESTIFTPTIEIQKDEAAEERFNFAHRSVYLLNPEGLQVEDNKSYMIGGKVMADPKRGTFSLAGVHWHPLTDDIFSFAPAPTMDDRLRVATRTELPDVKSRMQAMVAEVRDHVVSQIYKADLMLESMVLPYFMPFTFTLGAQRQQRISPSVMILGDTNTGKSTVAMSIINFFGAGRYTAADSNPTHAGLLGGNMKKSNGSMSFVWGLLPNSHGGLVYFDEYNKLSPDTIGGLTNTLTSGVAERVTTNGTRRTRCWVRLTYLCNPRGTRKLTSYSNPLDAALTVATTVQDLGRIEYVCVQLPVTDHEAFKKYHAPEVPNLYTKDIAHYHLQWAWTRKPEQILFQNADYIYDKAIAVSEAFGGNVVLLAAQARFKVARIAAAVATLLYSTDAEGNVIVTNEHVDYAIDFLYRLYAPYIDMTALVAGTLPSNVSRFFDSLPSSGYRRLRMLSTSDRWSSDDLTEVFGGQHVAAKFLDIAYFDGALITRQRGWYKPRNAELFSSVIDQYLTERERLEVATRHNDATDTSDGRPNAKNNRWRKEPTSRK